MKKTYNIPLSAGSMKEVYGKIEEYFASVYDLRVLLTSERPEKTEFICETSYRHNRIAFSAGCELTEKNDGYVLTVTTTNEGKRTVAGIWYIIAAMALTVIVITKYWAAIIFVAAVSMIFLMDNNSFTEKEEKRITEYIDKAVKRIDQIDTDSV